jgi:hypothetical protein
MGVLTLAIGAAPLGMLLLGALAGAFSAPLAVAASAAMGGTAVSLVAWRSTGLLRHGEPEAAGSAVGTSDRAARRA